jgi:hypothetical protein
MSWNLLKNGLELSNHPPGNSLKGENFNLSN